MRTPADAVGSRDARSSAGGALEESVQALMLPIDLVHRGDIVSIGQRFYRVDTVGEADDRSGFPLITLRSLETGALGAIEFRNADDPVSVLRFPAPATGGADDARLLAAAPQSGEMLVPNSGIPTRRRPAGAIHLAEPVDG